MRGMSKDSKNKNQGSKSEVVSKTILIAADLHYTPKKGDLEKPKSGNFPEQSSGMLGIVDTKAHQKIQSTVMDILIRNKRPGVITTLVRGDSFEVAKSDILQGEKDSGSDEDV